MKLFPDYEEPARLTLDQEHAVYQLIRSLDKFCCFFMVSEEYTDDIYDIAAASIQCANTGLRPYQLDKVIRERFIKEGQPMISSDQETPAISEIDRKNVISSLRRSVAEFAQKGISTADLYQFAVKVKCCLDNGVTSEQLAHYIEVSEEASQVPS